jgi:hypothetical protein
MSRTNVPGGLWRKASYSNGQGSCVEVGQAGPAVAVRDTKDPAGPALAFAPGRWQDFTRRVRNGTAGR